ncbi:MAG: hypothetical protein AVDCRST_MAG12-210, partial [uncultured Rubrobacteraceae bacterium]
DAPDTRGGRSGQAGRLGLRAPQPRGRPPRQGRLRPARAADGPRRGPLRRPPRARGALPRGGSRGLLWDRGEAFPGAGRGRHEGLGGPSCRRARQDREGGRAGPIRQQGQAPVRRRAEERRPRLAAVRQRRGHRRPPERHLRQIPVRPV